MGKEKKEIGKLLELLNEYEAKLEEMPLVRRKWREESGILYRRFMNVEDAERMVISKSFGFIKWLVENDKIDIGEKLFNLTKNDNRKSTICDLDNNDFSWEDTFLMLLSISSSPIEDLLLYLK